MQTHVKVLGVVYLAVGGCMLLAAAFLFLTMGSVAGIVGATAEPRDAAIAIPILGLAGTALALFLTFFALPSLITGYGLLYFKSWSRIVGIVLSALSLVNFPVGTAIGIYGLWVLLNKETERLFSNLTVSAALDARTVSQLCDRCRRVSRFADDRLRKLGQHECDRSLDHDIFPLPT